MIGNWILRGAALTAGCLMSLTASAQSVDAAWKAVQAAAVKEGRVVLYTELAPGLTARLKTEFEKANPGILVEHVRLTGNALTDKLERERNAGLDGADMALGSQLLVWYEQPASKACSRRPSARRPRPGRPRTSWTAWCPFFRWHRW